MTSSIDYGIVQDDTTANDWQLLEKDRKAQQRWDQNEKEIEKQRREKEKDPDATIKAYRYSHFICVRSKTTIPKKHEAEIIQHKSTCPYCQETIQEKAREMEAIQDGNCKMRYILHSIENSKEEIENLKRKIQREKSQKLENYELVIRMSESKIQQLENHIFSEGAEEHKLLRHENEITRAAAQELYDEYLRMSESQRRRCQY
jgi:hypothetical protein